MPIEFRCTKCDRLLRTPDGTSGKDAKCPQCGTLVRIPEMAPPPPPPSSPPPELTETQAHGGASNPYESPKTLGVAEPAVARGFQPTRIDLGETISRTWEIYKSQLGACVLGALIMVFCTSAANGILFAVAEGFRQNAGGFGVVAITLVEQIAAQTVGAFFAVGMIAFMLRIARGQGSEYGALFSGGPLLVPALVINIIVTIAVVGGLILLIVPGIILGLMLSLSLFMLVDQKADIFGSIKMSATAMQGNKLTVLAIYLITGVLGLLLSIVTCFLGWILVVPFMALLSAVIYLGATGQQTVLDATARPNAERQFSAAGAPPTE